MSALVFGGCDCDGDDDTAERSTCAMCLDTKGVHVTFPDEVGSEHSGLVLFSGYRAPGCEEDVLCTATSELFLGEVGWGPLDPDAPDYSASCRKTELVAFTANRAPYVETAPGKEIQVNFLPAIKVPVTIWVVYDPNITPTDKQDQLKAWAYESANDAKRVFEELGTGIDLQFTIGTVDLSPANQAAYFSCTGDATAIAGRTSGYDSQGLNIYYVSPDQFLEAGVNCYSTDPDNTHQEIMFVNRMSFYSPMQMAHELGHALGLLRSLPRAPAATVSAVYQQGDVDELHLDPYLAMDNLMRSKGMDFRSATIGQVYRMHFDQLSWLSQRGYQLPHSYPRKCQDDPVAPGDCPPLTLNPPRGWP